MGGEDTTNAQNESLNQVATVRRAIQKPHIECQELLDLCDRNAIKSSARQ